MRLSHTVDQARSGSWPARAIFSSCGYHLAGQVAQSCSFLSEVYVMQTYQDRQPDRQTDDFMHQRPLLLYHNQSWFLSASKALLILLSVHLAAQNMHWHSMHPPGMCLDPAGRAACAAFLAAAIAFLAVFLAPAKTDLPMADVEAPASLAAWPACRPAAPIAFPTPFTPARPAHQMPQPHDACCSSAASLACSCAGSLAAASCRSPTPVLAGSTSGIHCALYTLGVAPAKTSKDSISAAKAAAKLVRATRYHHTHLAIRLQPRWSVGNKDEVLRAELGVPCLLPDRRGAVRTCSGCADHGRGCAYDEGPCRGQFRRRRHPPRHLCASQTVMEQRLQRGAARRRADEQSPLDAASRRTLRAVRRKPLDDTGSKIF